MDHTMFKNAARFLTRPGMVLVLATAAALTTACDLRIVHLGTHPPATYDPNRGGCQPGQPCPPPNAAAQQGLDAARLRQPGSYDPTRSNQQPPHVLGSGQYRQGPNVLVPDQVPPGFPPFGGGGGSQQFGSGNSTVLIPDPLQGHARWTMAMDFSKQAMVVCLFPYEASEDVANPNKIICQHTATGARLEPFLQNAITVMGDQYAPSSQSFEFPDTMGRFGGTCLQNHTPVMILGDGRTLRSGIEESKCWNINRGIFVDPQRNRPLRQEYR